MQETDMPARIALNLLASLLEYFQVLMLFLAKKILFNSQKIFFRKLVNFGRNLHLKKVNFHSGKEIFSTKHCNFPKA